MQGVEREIVWRPDREEVQGGRARLAVYGDRGTVDVEEFRGDGKSKGSVRERPDPFEV